jgi:hypothetical protein
MAGRKSAASIRNLETPLNLQIAPVGSFNGGGLLKRLPGTHRGNLNNLISRVIIFSNVFERRRHVAISLELQRQHFYNLSASVTEDAHVLTSNSLTKKFTALVTTSFNN